MSSAAGQSSNDAPAYPAARESVVDLRSYPALHGAWRESWQTLAVMRELLAGEGLPPEVRCVAVSGSLGRMEQTSHSDVDLIVVLHDDIATEGDRAARAFQSVWRPLASLGLPPAKTHGIFAAPTSQTELCRPVDVGKIDEAVGVFGKRIQLLLDAQPLYADASFASLQEAVLARYGQDDALRHGDGHWTCLQRDVIRYWQSMAVQCRWRQRDDAAAWRIRNLKLQHSRRLMVAGLLLLLGEATRRPCGNLDWLGPRLSLTPLERVASVYLASADDGFGEVAAVCERFVAAMQDAQFRRRLAQPAHRGAPPDDCEAYRERSADAHRMAGELLRFVFARRGEWSDRFLTALLF